MRSVSSAVNRLLPLLLLLLLGSVASAEERLCGEARCAQLGETCSGKWAGEWNSPLDPIRCEPLGATW